MTQVKSTQPELPYDPAWQTNLLTLMVKKEGFMKQYLAYLKPEHFGKIILTDLYQLMTDYNLKYEELPDQETLVRLCQDFLKNQTGSKPDLARYEATIKKIFSGKIQAEQYTIVKVSEFIKQVIASEAVISYSESQHAPQDRKRLLEAVTTSEQLGIDPEQKKLGVLEKGLFFQDLMKKELPKDKFYIGRGLMPTTGYVILGGYTKRGKTTLASQMALCLVNALPFLEYFPITEKVRVLYLDGEGNPMEFQDRLRQQVTGLRLKGHNIRVAEQDFRYQSVIMDIFSKEGYQELDFTVQMFKPQVTIIDPVMKFSGSKDMNRLENAAAFTNILDRIGLEQGCVWLLLHHNKKPQEKQSTDPIYQIIGSSAWANLCQTFIGLKRTRKDNENRKTLTFEMRHAETPEPMYLWQNEARIHEKINKEEKVRKNRRAQDLVDIVNNLGGHAPWKTIMKKMKAEHGLSSTLGDILLKSAERQGLIHKAPGKRGQWLVDLDTV